MLKHKISLYLMLLLLVIVFATCRKEVVVDNSDKNFSLKLQVTDQAGIPLLSWDKMNHSTFSKYILLSAETPISFGLNPLTPSALLTQKVVYTKRDSTSFLDNGAGFSPQIFYKLYLDIGGRFLESDNVVFNQQIQSIPGSQSTLLFDTEEPWVITLNPIGSTANVTIFNYLTNTIVNSSVLNFGFFSILSATIGKEGNNKVLYVLEGSTIRRYSLPELQLLSHVSHSENIAGPIVANNNNTLFYTTFESSQALILRRQSTLQKFFWHSRNNYFERRGLALINPTTNLIIEYSTSHFIKYTINDASGALTLMDETDLLDVDNIEIFNVAPISADKAYFIPKMNGDVYDQNFNKVMNVSFQQLNHAAFSAIGDAVYYSISDFNSGQQKASLVKVAFPSGNVEQSIPIVGTVSVAGLFPLPDGSIFAVIRDFSNDRLLCKTIKF